MPHRFVLVHEDEPRRPPVLARQLAQRSQDAGRRFERKTLNRHRLHEVAANFGHHPTPQLFAANDRVEIHRVARQLDRVIQAGDAVLKPSKLIVMNDGRSVFVHDLVALQAAQLQRRRQPRFDAHAITLEVFDQRLRVRLVIRWRRVVVEHQFNELAFGQQRWEVRHRQHEVPFVHRAKLLEAPAPLLVDCCGDGIREMRQATLRVVGRRAAHGVDVRHPAVAHVGHRLVEPERHHLAHLIGAAGVVVALIEPRGHECTVLADDHAIVDQRRVVQQIGQAGVFAAVLFQLQLGVYRTDAREQDQQQHRAQAGDCEGESFDHHR